MKKRAVALILGISLTISSLFSTGVYASSGLDVPEVSLGDVEQESSEGDLSEDTGKTPEDVEGSVTNEDIGNTSEGVEGFTPDKEDDKTPEDAKGTTEQQQNDSNDIVEEFEEESKIPAGEYIDDVTNVGTGIRDELSLEEEARLRAIEEAGYNRLMSEGINHSIAGSTEEDNDLLERAFDGEFDDPLEPSLYYYQDFYDELPAVGEKWYLGSLVTLHPGTWLKTNINITDHWDGYFTPEWQHKWDVVETWDRGVIGGNFPNDGGDGVPLWCLEPGKNYVSTNRIIGNALDWYSQEDITVLGLLNKYVNDNRDKFDLTLQAFKDEPTWHSAAYYMEQLCFWTYLESVHPKYVNGYTFVNKHGITKTIHNAPVTYESNCFWGGGREFVWEAINWALDNRANYKGYGKVMYNTTIENQLCGVFKAVPVEKPKASLDVVKTSANSAITNNNGNYSLAGAIYGVYRDQSCSNEVGRITTDSSGKGRLNNLDLGTYYVKELKASPGYELDTQVHAITLTR